MNMKVEYITPEGVAESIKSLVKKAVADKNEAIDRIARERDGARVRIKDLESYRDTLKADIHRLTEQRDEVRAERDVLRKQIEQQSRNHAPMLDEMRRLYDEMRRLYDETREARNDALAHCDETKAHANTVKIDRRACEKIRTNLMKKEKR